MGYTKQNFKSGDILTASQLNAMDEQIALSAETRADWNENNEESQSFVRNRTHFYDAHTTVASFNLEDLKEGDVIFESYATGSVYRITNVIGGGNKFIRLEEGLKIELPVNGPSTYAKCVYEDGMYRFKLASNPFAGISNPLYITMVDVTQLDEIFIPDTIARVNTNVKEFIELEYLEGTEGQKISTDILLTESDAIEVDYMIPNHALGISGDKVYINTVTTETNTNRVRLSTYGNNKKIYVRFGDTSGTTLTDALTPERMSGTLVLKKNAFIINGETLVELNYKAMPETTLDIFSTAYPSYIRMYSVRIVRNGEIIHNLVPNKRVEDDMAGFLDTVTGEFYANIGEQSLLYKEKDAVADLDDTTKEKILDIEQFREDDFVTKKKDFLLKQGTNDKGESKLFPLLSTTSKARCFAVALEKDHTYEIKIKNNNPLSTTWRMRVALWDKAYSDIKFVPAKQDDVQNIAESVGTPASEILISDYQTSNEYVGTYTNTNGYKTLMGLLAWDIEYEYLDVSIRDLDAVKLNEDIKISMENITDDARREILKPWSKFTKTPINEQDKINLTNILVSNMGRCNKATQRIMELAYDFWKHRDEFMYSNGTARDNAWNYWSTEGYYDVNTGNTITAENAGWKKIDCSTFVYYVSAGIGYYSSPYYNALEHTDVVKGALANGEEMNSPDATVCRTGKMWIRAGRPLKLESADSSKYYFTGIFGYAEDDTLVQTFDTISIGTTFTPNTDVKYIRAEMKVSSTADYAPAVTTIPKAPAAILKKLRIRENEQLEVRGLCPNDQRYAKHMCQWYDENGYAPNYNRWNYGDNEFPVGAIMWWGRNTATTNYKGITHITMYIGSGYLIHSSTGSMGLTGGQGIHIQTLEELFGSYNEPLSGVAIPEYITDYSEEKKLLGIE